MSAEPRTRSKVFLLVVLLCSLLLSPVGSRAASAQGAPPPLKREFVRFDPVVIYADGVDSTTVQVRVSGPVAKVQAVPVPGILRVDGQVVRDRFDLFDDGTHGDERAGDQVFTRSGITSLYPGSGMTGMDIFLIGQDGREVRTFGMDGVFPLLSPSLHRDIIRLSDDLQVTPYLANFRDNGQLLKLGPSVHRIVPPDLRSVARRFYERFPDDYDFLVVFTSVEAAGPYFHEDVRNDVRGIGKPLLDLTAQYGSQGRLLAVSFHGARGADVLTHEVTHQWGVSLSHSLELDDGGPHWGAVNIPGYLLGLDFRENGDGSYTITWRRTYRDHLFPPMELYLMGLLPAEEVPPVTVLRGVDANKVRAGDRVHPTGIRKVTIQDVIAVHGPRIPDARSAPKSFHMAGILLTPGRLASLAEMAFYSRLMEHFGSDEGSTLVDLGVERPSFAFATGGRGRMVTVLGPPR